MKKIILPITVIIGISLSACSQSDSISNGLTTKDNSPLGDKTELCSLFTSKDLSKMVNVDENQITQTSIYGCQYTWEKSNLAEIEEQNNQIYASFHGNVMELAEQLLPTENKVELSTSSTGPNKDFAFRSATNQLTPEEQANIQSSINKAISQNDQFKSDEERQLAQGLTNIITKESQSGDFIKISGLGDQAAWSEDKQKLVVLKGENLLAITVESEGNKKPDALSKEIADLILNSF